MCPIPLIQVILEYVPYSEHRFFHFQGFTQTDYSATKAAYVILACEMRTGLNFTLDDIKGGKLKDHLQPKDYDLEKRVSILFLLTGIVQGWASLSFSTVTSSRFTKDVCSPQKSNLPRHSHVQPLTFLETPAVSIITHSTLWKIIACFSVPEYDFKNLLLHRSRVCAPVSQL